MFQNSTKIILPLCVRKKTVTCSLVPCVSLVESLELYNAKKGNLLEFLYSVSDGNYALSFLVS